MKTTEIQDAEMMAAPLTPGDLVSIAHVLIDAQDIDDNPDDAQLLVRAGIKTGITAMCMAATSALNACGANASSNVFGPALAIPANAGTSAGKLWGLAAAPASPAEPANAAPDSGLTAEKMAKLVTMQRRACELLEATGFPGQVEAAGALRSATGDLWDAVREQVTINMLPSTLDNWMTTPAGLARVLVGALREERIDEPGEYNDAVEDCIVAVVGTLSAGAGADTAQKWAELSAMAPKVPVDDVAGVLAQLRGVADQASDDDPAGVCRRAIGIIEGLLPHAGAGVEA
jgi:hypothetical protein